MHFRRAHQYGGKGCIQQAWLQRTYVLRAEPVHLRRSRVASHTHGDREHVPQQKELDTAFGGARQLREDGLPPFTCTHEVRVDQGMRRHVTL